MQIILDIYKSLFKWYKINYVYVNLNLKGENMNQKEFGELIKQKRKEKNLTQNELSEKLGLSSYKTISKWENGIYMPDISLLTSISEILDVSLYELLGGKENMKKENVEEVLKNTINKASEKNKILSILKILIIILSIILITISI